jgi:hypothetical protein
MLARSGANARDGDAVGERDVGQQGDDRIGPA